MRPGQPQALRMLAAAIGLAACVHAARVGSPERRSQFEQRWLAACGERGRLGKCPAFEFGEYFDIDAESRDDGLACSAEEQAKRRAIRTALSNVRAELRQCLSGAEEGSWIELELAGSRGREGAPGLSASAVACVAERVERALSSIDTAGVPNVAVIAGTPGSTLPAGVGFLSKQGIRNVIHGHIGEVRACYEASLEVWPRLQGKTATQFVIAPDGSVAFVHTRQSSLGNPALECCINTALRGWRFEQPAGAGIVIVTYPFVLEQR